MDPLIPTAFVSHGAPSIALEDCAASRFLKRFEDYIGRPTAIVIISAHWIENEVQITTAETLPLIYDFYGFKKELYELQYSAVTAQAVAEQILTLLKNAGIPAIANPNRGLDHGAWIPLRLMFADAGIPVVQMSIINNKPDVFHLRVGRALTALKQQGILVLGSGSMTHNLSDCLIAPGETNQSEVPKYASEFVDWVEQHGSRGDDNALLNWRQNAPYAQRAHPTTEHFIPFIVALGAAGRSWMGERIHDGFMHKSLSMDAYLFKPAS